MKKDVNESNYREKIEKICNKAWGLPEEQTPNSMTIAKSTFKSWFRFNNYRRQTTVKTKDNSTIQSTIAKLNSTILKENIKFSKHTKLITVLEYRPNITIQYGKTKLTGIWKQNIIDGIKEGYLVERTTINEIQEWVDDKTESIKVKIDKALECFIRECGIKEKYKRLTYIWKRKELEIKGDDFIDGIPKECILHDTVGKKVYEAGFEFNDELYVKNYIKSRAIEDISPEIAKSINDLSTKISSLNPVSDLEFVRQLIQESNTIQDMLDQTRILIPIKRLSQEELRLVETDIETKWKD